jgi:glucose-6-phosphate isomerase
MSHWSEHQPDQDPWYLSSQPVLPFTIAFDMQTGLTTERPSVKRYLSDMKDMFADRTAVNQVLKSDNPMIYEFYEMKMPNQAGDLQFGTSIVYPGRVGHEYYMTKGHFHQVLETAEVYYVLQGTGFMLLETPEGQTRAESLSPSRALYVPPRWAHRSINTGTGPLITFFVFRGDAGHDYGTIEEKGYRKLIVADENNQPQIVPNPNWAPK